MSLAVLELNDQSLLIQADGGALLTEPGFASLGSEGIETGEVARARAWQEPQHGYNQYWCQLNLTPLPGQVDWARHHADIAFAQLKKVWQGAGEPTSLILLVPGSFSDNQLSLLLGLVSALPCNTLGVIDNALAACFQVQRDTLFVDMQLHQSVVSVCRPSGDTVRIAKQEVFSDLGMNQIQNSVARHISDLLIESTRYDPLHTSSTEQDIFNRIPAWLTRLRWENEIPATLNTAQGELAFVLRRKLVRELINERLLNLHAFIDRHRSCELHLSHASAVLTGLSDALENAEVAGQTVGMDNGFSFHIRLSEEAGNVYRICSLEQTAGPSSEAVTGSRFATHLLFEDHALPLHKPVSIHIGDEGVELANRLDDTAALTLVLRKRSLETVHKATGVDVILPDACRPGDTVVVAGHVFRLIEVQDD
jgi:hypothetical protein